MPRDYKAYLEDIVQAAQKINRYISELSLQSFSADEKTIDAVVRNLEVIGEAVRNIPGNIRERYPRLNGTELPDSEIFSFMSILPSA